MNKQFYFISGLPRSGSTLLSAILRQNPDFYADISSPLHGIVTSTVQQISTTESSSNIGIEQRMNICHGIFNGYFAHLNNPVVIDTNRQWTANTTLLQTLFRYTKIIACVRDPRWILDSFELIAAKNALYYNGLIDHESNGCVETRCTSMMDVVKRGTVIKPYMWLKDGLAMNSVMI